MHGALRSPLSAAGKKVLGGSTLRACFPHAWVTPEEPLPTPIHWGLLSHKAEGTTRAFCWQPGSRRRCHARLRVQTPSLLLPHPHVLQAGSPSSALFRSKPSVHLPDQQVEVPGRGRSSGPLCAELQMERKPTCLLSHVRGRGSCPTSQKVRGGPASPDPVSIVKEPRARRSWGLLGIWTWPGTFIKPQLSLGWGRTWGLPSSPLVPKKMPSGPYRQRCSEPAPEGPGCWLRALFLLGPQAWLPGGRHSRVSLDHALI